MTMGIYDELARIEDEPDRTPQAAEPKTARAANRPKPDRSASPPHRNARHDVATDLVTLPLGPIDLRTWRRALENTETRNSALRLTSAERNRVEDLVRELWRLHKLRTSMNEVARLGLRVIERDFRQSGERSLVYRVKHL